MDKVKSVLSYETIKLVTVTNWKLGLLHRGIQLAVVIYIFVYAIGVDRGYQKVSQLEGVVYTKVKGVGVDERNGGVYDSGDLVVPPTEPNALFITTRFLRTLQTEDSVCVDMDKNNSCSDTSPCVPGVTTSNGVVQSTCLTNVSRCLIKALSGIPSWTVFIRTHVTYTAFGLSSNNADTTKLGYNIFSLATILDGQNFTEVAMNGGIVNVKIDWSCNLDFGASNCKPTHKFFRVDAPGTASSGFNYRQVFYLPDATSTNFYSQRVYAKFYGIRFVFQLTGTGRKFDFAATIITIGSGAAFFSIATIVTDFAIQYFHPHKEAFEKAKRQPLDLDAEADFFDDQYQKH